MVSISFSIDKLWPLLWTGLKTQSMRPVYTLDEKTGQIRENKKWKQAHNHLQEGSEVFLQTGWKRRSPTGFRLFEVQAHSIIVKKLGELSSAMWRLDGFDDYREGMSWFGQTYPYHSKLGGIDDFPVYVIRWQPGNCGDCQHRDFCLKYNKREKEGASHPEATIWPDRSWMCSGFSTNRKEPYPLFVDINTVIPNVGIQPPVLPKVWIHGNCDRCTNRVNLVPGIGNLFDHRTNSFCMKDTARSDYPGDLSCTDLYHYVTTQVRRTKPCADFNLGDPIEESYENEDDEEDGVC